jgi:alpha-glucosidase
MPIDARGIESVERLLVRAPRIEGATTIVHRPTVTGGATAAGEPFVFAVDPELEPIACAESPPLDPASSQPLIVAAASNPPGPPDSPVPVVFEWDGSLCRAQIRFPLGTSTYGAGLAAGPLLRTGRSTVFWNTDAFRYGEESPALYQSHPYALCILPGGEALGVLAHSTRRGGLVACRDGLELHFEAEPFDLWIISAATPEAVHRQLAVLIGPAPLPPIWALGYHQCRWSYMTRDEVLAVAREMRERKIPCDAVWLDIDHSDRFKAFTFDPFRFPEPRSMLDRLHADGFHAVAIADPGLADVAGDAMIAEGLARGLFVRDALGRPWRGRVWPGVCLFPDFTQAETRDWWAEHAAGFAALGLDGLWNDMNEPSIFRTPSRTMPDDAVHRGFGGGSHARFHNVYGMLMSAATREGLVRAHPDRRPFVLTRSSFLGGARYAAAWTGDNQARWEDLRWSIAMVANLGLAGQAFSGPDIGGYDGDPSSELFVRWFELGAYLPFCRGHAEKGSCRKEPWALGPDAERHVRSALERRMRLLPFLYTLFRAHEESGLPVVRPLFWADPADARLREVDDQFLLGDELLVAPVVARGARSREIVLPWGDWFDFETGERHAGGRTITMDAPLGRTPVLARAGAIVVLGPVRQHTAAAPDGPLEVRVFLDRDGRARGRLYEDAGDGFDYRRGVCCDRTYAAEPRGRKIAVHWSATGSLFPKDRPIIVRVAGGGSPLAFEGRDTALVVLG